MSAEAIFLKHLTSLYLRETGLLMGHRSKAAWVVPKWGMVEARTAGETSPCLVQSMHSSKYSQKMLQVPFRPSQHLHRGSKYI